MSIDNRDYIYTFDVDKQKIITINVETGEQITAPDNTVHAILNFLQKRRRLNKLRMFAIWCARQTNNQIKPLQKKFFNLARQAIELKAERAQLYKLYASTEREAVAIDSVGLRQGSARAAGFLISRECINPDALQGARNAARFHCLWAEMKEKENQQPQFLANIGPATVKQTIAEVDKEQINFLLDLIGEKINVKRIKG